MKTLLCVLVFGIGGLLTQTTFGCTCVTGDRSKPAITDPAKLRESLRRSYLNEFHGALFTGTVINIKTVKRMVDRDLSVWDNQVSVRVDRYWLGIADPITVIYTGSGGADCGVDFTVGKQYLFTPQLVEGKLRSGICDYDSKDSMLSDGKAASMLDEVLGERKRFSRKLRN